MAKSRLSLVQAVLLATTALALPVAPFAIGEAAAKVGVTSATDGDPLGKPPSEAERVLRIGIDVQANELITTRANDRAHLLFLDGSSLTVGPNARLTIDRFVYDPNTKTGELAINASKGVLRLVGGRISKTNPITITTPSSTIGIRGGITILDVTPNQTVSTFVFGNTMTVSAGGRTQNVTRPGSQVTTNAGSAPGRPVLASQSALSGQLGQLEGGGGSSSAGGGTAQRGGNADQAAQSSGFSTQNSGQGVNVSQVTSNNNFGSGPGPRNRNPSDTITNAISNSQQVVQQDQLVQQAQAQIRTQIQGQGQAQTPTPTQLPTPSQTPTPTTPATQVIVTRGAFSMEPRYTNFTPQTLAVTPVPANNALLTPTGTVSNGTATISLADGRSFSVPWQPGNSSFAISLTHPTLGPLTGTGFVSPTGDFFAYGFTDSNGKKLGFVGGTPTTLGQFPTTGFATHVLSTLNDPGGRLPFSNTTVGKDPDLRQAASVSPLYSVYSSQTGSSVGSPAPGNQTSSAMQSTVAISGQGANQKSYMGVFIGDYFRDYNNNTNFNSGGFFSTYRTSSTDRIGRQVSSEATFDTGGGNSIYGPNADYMVYTPNAARTDITTSGGVTTSGTTTRIAQASFDQPYTNLNGSDYNVNMLATKTVTPSTVGQTRTDQINQNALNGFVGGIVESRDNTGNFSSRIIGGDVAGNGSSYNGLNLQTSAANNRAAATISISNWDGTTTSAQFQLGSMTGGRYATSAFIDDKIYAVRDRPATSFPAGTTTSVTKNSVTSTGVDVTSSTTVVSYNAAPVASFFAAAGVTPCTCEFLTWGWWSGNVVYGPNSSYSPNGRDRINLATYVAGTMTPIADLNALTGTATFTGHMVGNVQNGTNAYIAAGTYTNQWNFGARNGIATMSFDGATYGGGATPNTIGFPTNPGIGTPTPLTSSNGRSLTLNGAFFSSPTTPAKGQAGNFAVTGAAYKAGGIFAAQRP